MIFPLPMSILLDIGISQLLLLLTIGNIMATKKTVKVTPPTRGQLRDALLGNAPKPLTKEITLFGFQVELHQPTLGSILEAQSIEDEKKRSVNMIIEYAYVPGTNETIFEPADAEMILQWPFGDELVTLQLAIAELTGVDTKNMEDDLAGNPLKEQS